MGCSDTTARLEKNGQLTVLADRYDGKRLNSPNDLVYRSDGALYFTDPPFGLPKLFDDPRKELPFSGVYCLINGTLSLVSTDLTGPNGLAFSPDERYLYVDDWDAKKKVILRYDVQPNGSLTNKTVFLDATNEPGEDGWDGLKVDRQGNVYASGPGGLWIISILANWNEANMLLASSTPGWIQQLVLNANQFIVKRALPSDPDARSIIAGYHWFGDWGRDTMIALPGLLITTGRPDIARTVLLAFARYVDGGMLPNNFPDAGGTPEYNTVDAALWFFEAVRQYFDATRDTETIPTLFPVLSEIIDAHLKGTRYQIHADEADGLLYGGEEGVQLTWMDARVGNKVITPRIGKPVEINALWYNALRTMATLAPVAGKSAEPFRKLTDRIQASFSKFWDEARGHCCDVIDALGIGNDTSLRPNQIFAVSLPESPLSPSQQKSVVGTCARRLLTSHGLRSLAMDATGYEGHYGGSPQHRDGIYPQGTVWGWLMGPFVLAHLRVYNNPEIARSFLEPIGKQITTAGLGTLSEIFDGDAPFNPRGCIAQAWTVAEVLRSWRATFG